MILLDVFVLWIHLLASIIFVGGSYFIWLVVWPASYDLAKSEAERTVIVGRIAKRFAYFTHGSLAVLVLSGLYLAAPYLHSPLLLSATAAGEILSIKVAVVVVMILLMYANNIYHGRKIMRLSAEGKLDEVKRVRRTTHFASFVTLGLMLITTALGVALVAG
jgi:putative copper resistance protein D